jgi:hypothetical protein
MSELCCEYHDKLPEIFEQGAEPDEFGDWSECGLAGKGSPAVCCRKCPQADWFTKGRGMNPEHIDYAKELCSKEV